MDEASFGSFVAAVPAPLAVGTLTLADGRTVKGFVCEAYAIEGAEDITAFGGWRAWLGCMSGAAEKPNGLDSAKQYENEDHDEDHAENTGRSGPPRGAIRPAGQGTKQQQNKNDEKNRPEHVKLRGWVSMTLRISITREGRLGSPRSLGTIVAACRSINLLPLAGKPSIPRRTP